jgi:hypothetical protein
VGQDACPILRRPLWWGSPQKNTGTPPAPLCWPWTTDRPINRFRFFNLTRDAAGKGGVIKRVIQRLNPRSHTMAKEEMLERTHIPEARRWVVEGIDKERARLNCIHHLVSQISYQAFSTNQSPSGTRAQAGVRPTAGTKRHACAARL